MKTISNKQIDEKRAALIELSRKAREIRDNNLNQARTEQEFIYWSSVRINDIIADWYKQESGATVFKTFKQWKQEGFNIKKGSKAFILWSKKKEVKPKETAENDSLESSYEFFPVAYLFSDLQVEKGGSNVN